MKRPAPITRAQIERAIKAAKSAGAVTVEIEAGGIKLRYSLGENIGEKLKAKLDKPRSVI